MTHASFEIAGRQIGPAHPPYMIAELSANHAGSIDRALATMRMAKERGADAVKLQSYSPETMTIDSKKPDFMLRGGLWDGYSLYDLYAEAQTPFAWHQRLFDFGREIGITVFSTPFDETAVDLLERLDAPAYKISSFEMTDLELIARVARTGKPMIISTGLGNLEEIDCAVTCARDHGAVDLCLLHCVSSYPAPVDQSNIRTLVDLGERFGVVSGLSDHTLGTAVSVAAVAIGAAVIEKHVILSRADNSADAAFSLEPEELGALCRDIRDAWAALGQAGYALKPAEAAGLQYRRSIYAVADIAAGETFTRDNVRVIRPGFGLQPRELPAVLGRKAACALARGDALKLEHIA